MLKKLPYLVLACLVFPFIACAPDKIESAPVLISANQLVFYDTSLLKRLSSNDSLDYQPLDYQISINRLTYRTTLQDGSSVTASGVVYIPRQLTLPDKSYPLLSFQHPTAYTNAEAPSVNNFAAAAFSYPLYFATHGYIVACPDYIGYGVTHQIPHDYEHRQTLAQATVDMLLATREFLSKKAIGWNAQLFLTGYSEGGFATLSAQKLLEEHYTGEFQVSGSSCGAGPYAMPTFYDYLTQKNTVGGIANYLYVWETLSYNRVYGLNKPISYYFKSPYAEQIQESLQNAKSIKASFNQICTSQFLTDIQRASSPFRIALIDNDLSDWLTHTPTQFIHSQQDEIIPFITSQHTYNSLRSRGSSNLHLITLPKGGHVSTEVLFVQQSLDWFEQLKR
ncbi:alpha/beta hydrolase family protein [Spirosoma fluminis]